MIVDDDPILCEFLAMVLTERGYRTVTAANGIEALNLIEREPPALVLLDMGMPRPGGRDLAGQVHNHAATHVPCVIMSGSNPSRVDGDDGVIAGYLCKPFGLDELFAVVEQHAGVASHSVTACK